MTSIRRCTCSGSNASKFQDEKYGTFMRVFNSLFKSGWRCTVCGYIPKEGK